MNINKHFYKTVLTLITMATLLCSLQTSASLDKDKDHERKVIYNQTVGEVRTMLAHYGVNRFDRFSFFNKEESIKLIDGATALELIHKAGYLNSIETAADIAMHRVSDILTAQGALALHVDRWSAMNDSPIEGSGVVYVISPSNANFDLKLPKVTGFVFDIGQGSAISDDEPTTCMETIGEADPNDVASCWCTVGFYSCDNPQYIPCGVCSGGGSHTPKVCLNDIKQALKGSSLTPFINPRPINDLSAGELLPH